MESANPAYIYALVVVPFYTVGNLVFGPCVYDGAVGLDDVVVTGRTPSETTFCFRACMVIYHIFCLLRLGAGCAMHYNIFYLSHLNIRFEVLFVRIVYARIFSWQVQV